MRRLPASFIAPAQSKDGMSLGTEGSQSVPLTAGDADLSIRARILGTVLHRTLKQIANEGIGNWSAHRLESLPRAWAAQLKEYGILASGDELSRLSAAVATMLADDQGQWILHNHNQAQCEQALGYHNRETNHAGTSVIDRTFVDNGIRWIIDYKLSSPTAQETEQQFIDRQTEAYRSQLKHYGTLYRKLESNPVRCALYFPQIPLFIEVDAE